MLFTFCFTMTTEYVWELFEYSMDRIFNTNMQRWTDGVLETLEDGSVISAIPYGSGLKDTMGDMGVNIIGCLGVCIYAIVGMKLKPDWFDGKLILTQAQVTELAAEKAEEELNREDAAEPAADDVDNDKAEFETAKSQAAPESDLENDGKAAG